MNYEGTNQLAFQIKKVMSEPLKYNVGEAPVFAMIFQRRNLLEPKYREELRKVKSIEEGR